MSLGALVARLVRTFRPALAFGDMTVFHVELQLTDERRWGVVGFRASRPVESCCWTMRILGLSGSAAVRFGATARLAAAAGWARATVAKTTPTTSEARRRPLICSSSYQIGIGAPRGLAPRCASCGRTGGGGPVRPGNGFPAPAPGPDRDAEYVN